MTTKKNRQESLAGTRGSFEVGQGVHYGYNGDSYPMTVLYVSDSGRKVYCSLDDYRVIDDLGGYAEGSRRCEFATVVRPIAGCQCFTLRPDGRWREKPGKGYGWTLVSGRVYSRNPSF